MTSKQDTKTAAKPGAKSLSDSDISTYARRPGPAHGAPGTDVDSDAHVATDSDQHAPTDKDTDTYNDADR